jgi:flagellar basal body P-ring formation protein FlgA
MTIFRHVIVVAAMLPALAGAQTFQSHDAIDDRVETSLVGTGLAAWPVDRRLKLAACPETLRVEQPASGLVAVHCDSLHWRVHARIDGPPATVTAPTPVIIKRGDPVTVNFGASGFSIVASGVAESEARIGDRVRVRVDKNANPVVGEAVDVGSVRVGALN